MARGGQAFSIRGKGDIRNPVSTSMDSDDGFSTGFPQS